MKTYTGINGVSITSGTELNAGTYVFSSSTGGNINVTIDGVTEDFLFDWSVSDEDITISTSTQVQNWTSSTRTIVIEEEGKKEMTWTLNEVQTDINGAYTFTATMEMSRR